MKDRRRESGDESSYHGINRAIFRHEHSGFWVSHAGVIICGVCHPPPTPELVKEWLSGDESTHSVGGYSVRCEA